MTQEWSGTSSEGHEYSVTVYEAGVGVSVRWIWGQLDGGTCSLEGFEEEYGDWVDARFSADVASEIRAAVETAREGADHDDDRVP